MYVVEQYNNTMNLKHQTEVLRLLTHVHTPSLSLSLSLSLPLSTSSYDQRSRVRISSSSSYIIIIPIILYTRRIHRTHECEKRLRDSTKKKAKDEEKKKKKKKPLPRKVRSGFIAKFYFLCTTKIAEPSPHTSPPPNISPQSPPPSF